MQLIIEADQRNPIFLELIPRFIQDALFPFDLVP
jgi:hypothetical protein